MRIKVDGGHIERGTHSGDRCPIALAVTAMLPQGKNAIVGKEWYAIRDDMGLLGKPKDLPKLVLEFVNRFDRGDKVEPFEFDIDLSYEGEGRYVIFP